MTDSPEHANSPASASQPAGREHRAEPAAPRLHRFETTAAACAEAAAGRLADGDVLVVDAERVVGFLVATVPAAITETTGDFSTLLIPAHELGAAYTLSANVAEEQARWLGAPVRIDHASPMLLAYRADLVAIDTGDGATHYADPSADYTLCESTRLRVLSGLEVEGRPLCPDCAPLARRKAAAKEADARAATLRIEGPVTDPRTHTFASSFEAYNVSQTSDDIRDGDVLTVPSEGIVAILDHAWPVALTAAHGELHKLTEPAAKTSGGRYVVSAEAAAKAAADLGVELEPKHVPPARYAGGDRIVCPDGATRTVVDTVQGVDGKLWLHTGNGSAWRADSCERVDTSRVVEARAAARRAVPVLRGADPGGDPAEAARELGDALRYLAQADLSALDDLRAETARRVVIDVPKLAVVPSDILRAYGARLTVLDTGVTTGPVGGTQQWWAEVEGVDEADRRATYRVPWSMGMAVETAAWDVVTVERIAPDLPV